MYFQLKNGVFKSQIDKRTHLKATRTAIENLWNQLHSVLQVALSGKYSRDYFNRHGDLRHIRRLRYWPLDNVLMEKYEYGEQDAKEFADFLVPLLDFVPEKRPTAAQCLRHSWVASLPRSKEPAEEERTCDAVQEGLRNIALVGGGLVESTPNGNVKSTNKPTTNKLVRNEGSHSKK